MNKGSSAASVSASASSSVGIVKMEVPKDGVHPKYNDAYFKSNAYCGGNYQASEVDKALFEAYVAHGNPPSGEHFQRWFRHIAVLMEREGI